MTLLFDTEYLRAGQEDFMKVIILANSVLYYLEQSRGAAVAASNPL